MISNFHSKKLVFLFSMIFSLNSYAQLKNLSYTDDSYWYKDGKVNLFLIVITETKRREGNGKPGKPYQIYKDGENDAIGYGTQIKYLSDEWKSTIRTQRYTITEEQARELMYESFKRNDERVKKALPHLNESQRWALKSLIYNWGYSNVVNSNLWGLLKKNISDARIERAWMQTQVATTNHIKSRELEIDLFFGRYDDAIEKAKLAYEHLQKRGDFNSYN